MNVSTTTTPRLALIRYSIYAIEETGEERLVDTTEEEEARKHGLKSERPFGPRLVVIGKSRLIDAVEEALQSMKEGEEKEIIAPPEKAYGERDESKVIRVPVKQLRRAGITPRVGTEVNIQGRVGRIVRVTERFAYIDLNHPLAGKKLRIWIKLEKELKTPDEKASHLVERWLSVKPVNIAYSEGKLEIELPPEVLAQKDLENKMLLMLNEIAETCGEVSEITLKCKFKVKKPAEEGPGGKPKEGEEEQETSSSSKEGK
jgi:FKBP-type peptidyl-prolyl cis-trans isomerase 2